MIPSSTYRIQFRNGMTFDRVADLIPYMKDLGISHLYASPVFTATTNSTHGYDVTDPNEIDPAIGGREGFDRMAAALKQAGMFLTICRPRWKTAGGAMLSNMAGRAAMRRILISTGPDR